MKPPCPTRLACTMALALLLPAGAALAQSTPIGEPYYAWFLRETYRTLDPSAGDWYAYHERTVDSGAQRGGTVLRVHSMGYSPLGFPALAMTAGYDDGHTFWSQVLSPRRGGPDQDVIGASATIHIAQSFRKDSADASLSFSFTGGKLQLMDYGSHSLRTMHTMVAEARFDVFVFDHLYQETVWSEGQSAILSEDVRDPDDRTDNLWTFTRTQDAGPTASGMAPWVWDCDVCGQGAYGFATATLQVPYTGVADLSQITTGQEFTVSFMLRSTAIDCLQGETAALAYARDPVDTGGGIGFAFSGLTPTDRPVIPAIPEPGTWALMAAGAAWLAWRRPRRKA